MVPEMIIFSLWSDIASIRVLAFCSKLAVVVLLCAFDVNGNNLQITIPLNMDAHLISNRGIMTNVSVGHVELVHLIVVVYLLEFLLDLFLLTQILRHVPYLLFF